MVALYLKTIAGAPPWLMDHPKSTQPDLGTFHFSIGVSHMVFYLIMNKIRIIISFVSQF